MNHRWRLAARQNYGSWKNCELCLSVVESLSSGQKNCSAYNLLAAKIDNAEGRSVYGQTGLVLCIPNKVRFDL